MEARGEIWYYLIEDPLGEGETIGYSQHQLQGAFEEHRNGGAVRRVLYTPRGWRKEGDLLRRFEEELWRRYEDRAGRRMDWVWFLRFCGAALCIYAFEPLFKLAYIPLSYHLSRYLFLTREIIETILDPIVIPFATALGFILGLSPLILTFIITHQYIAREARREGEIAEWLRELMKQEVEIRESGELRDFRENIRGLVEEVRGSFRDLYSPAMEVRVKTCRRLMRRLAEMQAQASYFGLEPLVDYYHRLKTSFYRLSRERRILGRNKALNRWLVELKTWR